MAKIVQHFLDRGDGATVELLQARPEGSQPSGAILFVHGNQGGHRLGAREAVDTGLLLDLSAGLQVTAAAVSQPGFGASDGPSDFCGPRTQLAIAASLSFLRNQPSVAPERIVLYGNSRGAIASAMAATRENGLRALILSSGVYDLKAAFESCSPGLRATIVSEAGVSEAAFSARSALYHADAIPCEVMLLHGRRDERADISQAERFAQALAAAGIPVTLHVFECGHRIPRQQLAPVLHSFLRRTFHPARQLH